MAISLPPPPVKAEPGTPVWNDWFQRLQTALASASGVAWGSIDKTGSNLADLALKAHSSLTSIQGAGSYHLSSTAATRCEGVITKAGLPTTTDIAAGTWAIYKDSTGGTVRLWANDGGVMKSVTLT